MVFDAASGAVPRSNFSRRYVASVVLKFQNFESGISNSTQSISLENYSITKTFVSPGLWRMKILPRTISCRLSVKMLFFVALPSKLLSKVILLFHIHMDIYVFYAFPGKCIKNTYSERDHFLTPSIFCLIFFSLAIIGPFLGHKGTARATLNSHLVQIDNCFCYAAVGMLLCRMFCV